MCYLIFLFSLHLKNWLLFFFSLIISNILCRFRFNEEGEELKENGENSTKQEQTKTKEETTEETKPKVNGDAGLESETVKENGVSSTKEEAETEVKSEAKTENTELGKLLMYLTI